MQSSAQAAPGLVQEGFHRRRPQPHQLLDGTMSYHDFSRDRNNRFDTQERAAKNRIIATKILHFYNVPRWRTRRWRTSQGSGPPPNKRSSGSRRSRTRSVLRAVRVGQRAGGLRGHRAGQPPLEIEGTNKKYSYCMKLCFPPPPTRRWTILGTTGHSELQEHSRTLPLCCSMLLLALHLLPQQFMIHQ